MRQNLAMSGGILVTLIPLAATGVLGLAAVVAIHELAEVAVILNGVRAGRRTAFASTKDGAAASEREINPQEVSLPVIAQIAAAEDGDAGCGCEPGCSCCSPQRAEPEAAAVGSSRH